MDVQSPLEFVAALKKNGADDQSVIAILRNAGWPEKESVGAVAAYYESLTGLPAPPHPRSIGGPREAFLHLLSFITLATWSIAAGSLWFTLIDYWFPDPVQRHYGDPMMFMARDLAYVLVAFPIFILVMRRVWSELAAQPAQADTAIRRWLTYLALLLAAGTVIGDFVAFVEHLLRGAITARFASKVAVVLALAGGIFWFFLGAVQPGGESRKERLLRHGRTGSTAAAILVALTLMLSFARFGSPAAHRLAVSDERRSEDLEAIAGALQNRWKAVQDERTPTLPQSIVELPESASLRLSDPVSGQPYRYAPGEGMRYQLCAAFDTDTTQSQVNRRRGRLYLHPAGEHCFAIDAPVGPK
jgi:hypothetical protein